MTDRTGLRLQLPTMPDLLRTVRAFLGGKPSAPENRYQAQVASYLLAICEREAGFEGPKLDDGSSLCAAIRAGERDGGWDGLIADLLDEAIVAVRITKPGHLAPMHRGEAA